MSRKFEALMTMVKVNQTIWKSALAAGIAWEVAQRFGASRPYFAPLAAILCLQVTVSESIYRGYQRVLGIVVGVVIADMASKYLGVHGWSIAVLVLAGTGMATWMKLGDQAIPQVGVSAMMVLTVGAGHYQYAFERIVDTLIGAVMAVFVNMLVVPPDFTRRAQASIVSSGQLLSQHFAALSRWLADGAGHSEGSQLQARLRNYVDALHSVVADVEQALQALQYSPLIRKRQRRLEELHDELLHLRQGYAHLTGMLRTLLEWQGQGMNRRDEIEWSGRCRDISDLIRHHIAQFEDTTSGEKAGDEAASQWIQDDPTHNRERHVGFSKSQFWYALYNDEQQLHEDFTVRTRS